MASATTAGPGPTAGDGISAEEFEAANRAGAARRARGLVTSVRYFSTGRRLSLRLSTGIALIVPVDQVQGLADASNEDLRDVFIAPGGLGLHFPRLDADVSAVGLLDGVFGSPSWMARELGRSGGRVTSERKSASSRENGRRGGRPPSPEQTAETVDRALREIDRVLGVQVRGAHAEPPTSPLTLDFLRSATEHLTNLGLAIEGGAPVDHPLPRRLEPEMRPTRVVRPNPKGRPRTSNRPKSP